MRGKNGFFCESYCNTQSSNDKLDLVHDVCVDVNFYWLQWKCDNRNIKTKCITGIQFGKQWKLSGQIECELRWISGKIILICWLTCVFRSITFFRSRAELGPNQEKNVSEYNIFISMVYSKDLQYKKEFSRPK